MLLALRAHGVEGVVRRTAANMSGGFRPTPSTPGDSSMRGRRGLEERVGGEGRRKRACEEEEERDGRRRGRRMEGGDGLLHYAEAC
eukprot:751004-Hanusia_phi.AAC.3